MPQDNREAIEIRNMLQRVIEVFAPKIDRKNITISFFDTEIEECTRSGKKVRDKFFLKQIKSVLQDIRGDISDIEKIKKKKNDILEAQAEREREERERERNERRD